MHYIIELIYYYYDIIVDYTLLIFRYNEYMAFGLRGRATKGSDSTVVWVDHKTGQPYAVDYYLQTKTKARSNSLLE